MGRLIEGVWRDDSFETQAAASGGKFVRPATQFRDWIKPGGKFPPELGRYRLYISHACPWCHRVTIVRALKGLESAIPITEVEPVMLKDGWTMPEGADPANGARSLWQVYVKAVPDYSGRVSVPVLWDTKTGTIVNNESSEIIRLLDAWPGAKGPTLRPPELAAEIDALNDDIYESVNNGVYRAGVSRDQSDYELAYDRLFACLDRLEERLKSRSFLAGERVTEADWRLFPTLVRFDAVYYGHFKCNRNRIIDMPELWDYTRALYMVPGVAATVHMDQIKTHYYFSHRTINPSGIVPKGPAIDFLAPTRRRVPTAP